MALPLPIRRTARVILVDALDRILLIHHIGFEHREFDALWVPPGGGLELGESYAEGARRELYEETGLADVVLGPCVWHRRNVFVFDGVALDFDERFFFCRIDTHDVGDHTNTDEKEAATIAGSRWWTVAEIEASVEYFAPRDLGRLIQPLLLGHFPKEPVVLGP